MKLIKTGILLLVLSVVVSADPIGENNDPALDADKIHSFLSDIEKDGYSGAVLVSDGTTVFKNCYGFADRENKVRCDPETVFTVGSITKQFTGAAILKLEMMGKLSVGDKLTRYFKFVPEDKKEITIHNLLTHSAGFPGAIGDDYEVLDREQYVERAFKTPLRFKVGSRYEYSNVGYSIAAAIVEKASGMSYEEFLNEFLFEPAGMTQTGYSIPKWKEKTIAVGYRNGKRWGRTTEKKWGKNAPSWHLVGNGGILSNVGDMYKWHLALLGEKILSKNAKAKFYNKHIAEGEDAGSHYGYGWAIFPTSRKTELVAHNGGNGVFFADFWRYLDEKVTIIMLTNGMPREFERVPSEISKSIFRKDYRPNIRIVPKKEIESLAAHPKGKLIQGFIDAVKTRDGKTIIEFAKSNFSKSFLEMADYERHKSVLSQLGSQLLVNKITKITTQESLTTINFGNGEVELRIRIREGKIAGIGF